MKGARFAERELTDANEETFQRLRRAEESLAELAGVMVRVDQVEDDLGKLGHVVEALDHRNQEAAAEADRRLVKLAEVLEGAESTE